MAASAFLHEGTNVFDAASNNVVLTIDRLHDRNLLACELQNGAAGDNNSSFTMQLQDHKDGEWYNFIADADWTSTTNPNLRFCSTNKPHTLAFGSKSHFHVRTNGAFAARFLFTNGGAGTQYMKVTAHRE